MSDPSRAYTLYRLYDAAGTLLYVGITLDVAARFREHGHYSPWFPKVTRTRLQPFGEPGDAMIAEMRAHRDERPRHNGRVHIPYSAHKRRRKEAR